MREKKDALILVDLQNDFIAPGALPVPDGIQVVPLANRLQPLFDVVVATQDWHPANHLSFASQHRNVVIGDMMELDGLPQIAWPDHCIAGTYGADFIRSLDRKQIRQVFRKGTNRQIDSYSGFFDNGHHQATGLGDFLAERQVTDVYILGLATDYCVKYTAIDARALHFQTHLVVDACRGVNLRPHDVDEALDELSRQGIELTESTTVFAKYA